MAHPEDLVKGTIVGINLVRHPTPIGPVAGLTDVIVRLSDGREVTAEIALPPRRKFFVMAQNFNIGSAVKVDLGTVLEPIRIVEIEDDPA